MNRRVYAVFAAAAISLFFLNAAYIPAATLEPVVTDGVVNAPIDAVWRAFTEKSVIEQWMVSKTDLDLKVGGLWRTNYSKDADLNGETAIHQTILAFDPGRMLAFRTIKFPANFPFPAITRTWTVVYFEAAGPGKTRVTTRMMGIDDDEAGRRMRDFFVRGNQQTLDALVKFFETGKSQR